MNLNTIHTYRNGLPYRAPQSSFFPSQFIGRPIAAPCIAINGPALDWTGLWDAIQNRLRQARFATSTLLLYRRVLRSFRTYAATHQRADLRTEHPCDVNMALVEDFIHHINRDHASWSWISCNIAVIRTVFDKLSGFTVTARLQTPRRPQHLPEIVTSAEASRLLEATPTIRDRLIIGLMYGSGLKVGEVCNLRWQNVDIARSMLNIHYNRNTETREVAIPDALHDVLKLGTEKCPPTDHVFPGASPGKPLTARLIERMIRRMATAANLEKIVTCMTLRHSYAVECLRGGMSDIQLKQNLGHKNIETTLEYRRHLLPTGTVSSSGVDSNLPVITPCPPLSAPYPSHFPESTFQLPASLPFPALTSGAREFVAMLKTRIKNRFLAMRSYIRNTS